MFGLLIGGALLGVAGVLAYLYLPPPCQSNALWMMRSGTVICSLIFVVLGRHAYLEGVLNRKRAIVGTLMLALILLPLFYGASPPSACLGGM